MARTSLLSSADQNLEAVHRIGVLEVDSLAGRILAVRSPEEDLEGDTLVRSWEGIDCMGPTCCY